MVSLNPFQVSLLFNQCVSIRDKNNFAKVIFPSRKLMWHKIDMNGQNLG